MSKPKNPMQKHEKCPDCRAQMGSAFVRIKNAGKRKWSNKDIKVCTNPHCSTILTHFPRNIYVKKTKINVAKRLGLNSEVVQR
ncbi:MAG TPA: hypothetical protein VNL34_04110 [Candidatus Nitrosotenuis sp.]|nr:hypothetical protein [Candidatus Nitrosotenuis sp.]